jgi:hypothetical protein
MAMYKMSIPELRKLTAVAASEENTKHTDTLVLDSIEKKGKLNVRQTVADFIAPRSKD